MDADYGFPSLGTPVVFPSAKDVEFINQKSPFGSQLAQPQAEIALAIGASLLGAVVGFAIQYVICCQATKRCG